MHSFRVILVILSLFILSNSYEFVDKPIPLLLSDAAGSKFIIQEDGLNFLRALEGNIAVVAIAGGAKTGKSFLLNNLIGIPHDRGFEVGPGFLPGTRGIWFWGKPSHEMINGGNTTVLYMDTEGLGAPGTLVESYDPKLCTFAVIFASSFYYNAMGQISQTNVNMLHTVSIVSKIFEKDFKMSFPLPSLFWMVQSFSFELGDYSPERYLSEFVLSRKENRDNNRDVEKFNEVIEVIQTKFPQSTDNILLLPHPQPNYKGKALSQLSFDATSPEYQSQVMKLRQIIKDRLRVKAFSVPVTGSFLAELTVSLIPQINSLSGEVGPVMIKEMANLLKQKCFAQYQSNMTSILLPSEPDLLTVGHNASASQAIKKFNESCPGSIDLRENKEARESLNELMNNAIQHLLKENHHVSWRHCSAQLREALQRELFQPEFDNEEHFRKAVKQVETSFRASCAGPAQVKQSIWADIEPSLELKRIAISLGKPNECVQELTRVVFDLFPATMILLPLLWAPFLSLGVVYIIKCYLWVYSVLFMLTIIAGNPTLVNLILGGRGMDMLQPHYLCQGILRFRVMWLVLKQKAGDIAGSAQPDTNTSEGAAPDSKGSISTSLIIYGGLFTAVSLAVLHFMFFGKDATGRKQNSGAVSYVTGWLGWAFRVIALLSLWAILAAVILSTVQS